MTKEEIYKKNEDEFNGGYDYRTATLNAMEEYAKQEAMGYYKFKGDKEILNAILRVTDYSTDVNFGTNTKKVN